MPPPTQMASRNRVPVSATPVASRSSEVHAGSSNETDGLPPYKKLSHPLDLTSVNLLRALQSKDLNDVKSHNEKAMTCVTKSAEIINDILCENNDYIKRKQKKWDAGKSLETKEDDEQTMQDFQANVDVATKKLEESMRALIDSSIAVQRVDSTLDWLRLNAPKHLEDEYQTQLSQRKTQRHVQSPFENSRPQDNGDDASDEEMDEPPSLGPTPLDGLRVALTGTSELFSTRMERERDNYTSLSLTTRYARNNNYRDFKRIVHDARFGDDAPPLGHENSWFTETGSPAPGLTDATQRGELDDDDDIIMDKATISTRCPITFQQFKEPYTSTKCPHTFEKNAMLDMIRTSGHRIGGVGRGTGIPAISCPVPGCEQLLTAADLRADPILIRKIKRVQRMEADDLEESSQDEGD